LTPALRLHSTDAIKLMPACCWH